MVALQKKIIHTISKEKRSQEFKIYLIVRFIVNVMILVVITDFITFNNISYYVMFEIIA